MRSNGVAGVTSSSGGRQAATAAMQARQQQLRHSEYLEASVAEMADNFQAMLWQQQRRGEQGKEGEGGKEAQRTCGAAFVLDKRSLS